MAASPKIERWVGIRPLRTIYSIAQNKDLKPKIYIAKIQESLGIVLQSLWTHQLKHEVPEIGSLLLSEEGRLFAYLLDQKSKGFFNNKDTLATAKKILTSPHISEYPGHAVICLFIVARAHSNLEIRLAGELCEAIAQCLKEIELFLNHGESSLDIENTTLTLLFKRWKQAFPYSE